MRSTQAGQMGSQREQTNLFITYINPSNTNSMNQDSQVCTTAALFYGPVVLHLTLAALYSSLAPEIQCFPQKRSEKERERKTDVRQQSMVNKSG